MDQSRPDAEQVHAGASGCWWSCPPGLLTASVGAA